MNTIINLGGSQAKRLSQVLSKHLSRSSQGKKVISQFEENRELGRKSLLAYLDTRLPEDETLRVQIQDALGAESGKHFNTFVTRGGSVGEIINIGQLENLNIHYSVFSDIRQVVALLLGVVIIGSVVAFGFWRLQQPRRMTKPFNIAVAEFVQVGETDPVASIVGQRIFNLLDGQYLSSGFKDVEVAHDRIGVIAGAEEASKLAEKINAHLVIYGDVAVVDEQVLVTPHFYIVDQHWFDVGEVNGEHKLAAPISLPKEELVAPFNEVLEMMEQRIEILTEFTKSLVYLATGTPGDLILAMESIERAITLGEGYHDFDGKEALYLFASDIARRQGNLDAAQEHLEEAMSLNDNYGRGYLAQANIYYDQANLYEAMRTYEMAKQLQDQPYGAYITEKASLGIGNCCVIQFQYANRKETSDQTGINELANCALDNYQIVISSYLQQKKPEANLKEITAWAYYGAGIVYHESGQVEAANQVLEEALALTLDPVLSAKALDRLDDLPE